MTLSYVITWDFSSYNKSFLSHITWSNKQKNIENYTPKCLSWQKNKHSVPNTTIEMEISDTL